ncbi:HEAT repeat domain-containing protein [Caulobacter sp. S45]|uniref:HEAT repeat domain-containing protein n=1 Tax=Caulobacter sp. S45 TaxID=1641861 RepID=UPI00131E7A94|nr:HEAT repeat domain-containing protein [Caulobacter sp. S45]
MPLIRNNGGGPPAQDQDARALLSGGTVDERWRAARALTGLPGEVEALGKALSQETDARVREAIFTSLISSSTAESIEAILPHLRSDDANLRTGALDALRAMPAAARPYLPALLADEHPDVRLLSCEIARALSSAQATPLLCDLLDREAEANVCAAAIDVLAEIGGPEALPVLARCAERFAHTPFLAFAIKVAAQRISGPRG